MPDLLEEVRGIAAGANLPLEMALATQFMDEEWAYRRLVLSRTRVIEKCSSVAMVAPGGPIWIGQNMDLGGYTDGHQVLLRARGSSSEPGALIFTIGSMIGLLGVNDRGIGVCVNSLPQLPSARAGVPVAFVIRKLLQAITLQEAVHTVQMLPHATGQHYLIADSSRIKSYEASPEGVREFRPADPSRVLHTNHPFTDLKSAPMSARYEANTIARLNSLTTRLGHGPGGLEAIQGALSSFDDPDNPICRLRGAARGANASTGFTTGSMISALRKNAVESWVSAGPPSMGGYRQVSLCSRASP
jgi:predicted choloylglycine hydrolase